MVRRDERDVVDLLLDQHAEFRRCFGRLKVAAGEPKKRLFENVTRLLAIHECAEQLVVHPVLGNDSPIVQERLLEEKAIEDALSDLYDLRVGNPRFDGRFAVFARLALEHAENEEREEFPLVRDGLPADELRRLAVGVRAVENAASASAAPRPERPSMLFARIRERTVRDRQPHEGSEAG